MLQLGKWFREHNTVWDGTIRRYAQEYIDGANADDADAEEVGPMLQRSLGALSLLAADASAEPWRNLVEEMDDR